MKDKIMDFINTATTFLVGVLVGALILFFTLNLKEKDKFTFYNYENLSTSTDERGRLHISFYEDEQTFIFSDSVALGIHAQVSSEVYKDYLEKVGK